MYTKIMTLTTEDAEEMLRHNPSNRPIRQEWVHGYLRQIRRGEYRPDMPPGICFTGPSENNYGELVDGQHRLLAISRSSIPVSTSVTFGVPMTHKASLNSSHPWTVTERIGVPKEDVKAIRALLSLVGTIKDPDDHEIADAATKLSYGLSLLRANAPNNKHRKAFSGPMSGAYALRLQAAQGAPQQVAIISALASGNHGYSPAVDSFLKQIFGEMKLPSNVRSPLDKLCHAWIGSDPLKQSGHLLRLSKHTVDDVRDAYAKVGLPTRKHSAFSQGGATAP